MEYLIVQGSSIRKQYVYCSNCGDRHIWLRAYPLCKGTYITICAKCQKKVKP